MDQPSVWVFSRSIASWSWFNFGLFHIQPRMRSQAPCNGAPLRSKWQPLHGWTARQSAGTDRSMHGTVGKASSADSTLVLHLLSKSPNCKRRRTCPRETTKKNTDFGSKRFKKGGQTSVVVAQTQANAKCIFKAGDFSWPIGINSFPNKKTLWIPCIKSSIHLEPHRTKQNSNVPLLEHFGSTQIAKWIVH